MALEPNTLDGIRQTCLTRTDTLAANGLPIPLFTVAEVNSYINSSIQELYGLLVEKYGNTYYLQQPYIVTTDGANQTFPLPKDFFKLIGAEVNPSQSTSPNYWFTLKPFNFGDRNRYAPNINQLSWGRTNLTYRIIGNTIWFTPYPAGGQQIRLWYVPKFQGLVDGAASSNIALQSQTLASAPWTLTGQAVSYVAGAPDGTSTASLLTPVAGNTAHTVTQVVTPLSTYAGVLVTLSAYLKAGTATWCGLSWTQGSECRSIVLNLAANSVPSTIVNPQRLETYHVRGVGNGWYRVDIQFLGATSGVAGTIALSPGTSQGQADFAGVPTAPTWSSGGTETVYAWGVQLELGASANLYAATTTLAATTSIDANSPALTFDGINGWEEYVIADVCIKLMVKEESDPAAFMAQKAELKQRIESEAENRDVGFPDRVTDSQAADMMSGWDGGGSYGGGM